MPEHGRQRLYIGLLRVCLLLYMEQLVTETLLLAALAAVGGEFAAQSSANADVLRRGRLVRGNLVLVELKLVLLFQDL